MQMNLLGSVMGACSRAEAAGTVTHSLIEATASALAAPPSRNSRADAGTSAVAISCARTTPRAARVAATLAARSAMRSPWSAPSRGDCPLVENRTSFMAGCLPTKMYRDYSPFRQGGRPRRIPCARCGVGGKIGFPPLSRGWWNHTGGRRYAQDIGGEVPDVAHRRVVRAGRPAGAAGPRPGGTTGAARAAGSLPGDAQVAAHLRQGAGLLRHGGGGGERGPRARQGGDVRRGCGDR